MERSTKLALLAGGSFLAGGCFNQFLTNRDKERKETERKERRTRERLENQESEIEDLKREITRLKGS